MADVSGKFFSAKKVRTGVSPSSPGVIEGETLPPLNPPGGGLNSVGLTMPSAFNVANSPLTSNGSLDVTGAGTTAQYIRGDGSLADFPQTSGGGSSVSYYLNGSVNQGTIGGVAYKELSKVPILGAGTDFTINADGYIASFITDAGDPNLLEIPGGNWNFETYFSASSGGGSPTFYVELYKYNGTTFTLIASSVSAPELIAFGTNLTPYFSTLAVPTTTLALTDRLAIRYYVTHSGRTITMHTENNHLCQIITTFTTGLTALNGLTAQVQNFAVGTTGTDFNIASAVATHTFNLPTASATNRGALSSANWTTFNNKQNALNGTGFVKISGTTISYDNSTYQSTADKGQPNGYASLDSNGKVPLTQINDALIGNVNFQGLWNAATNSPTLANPPAAGTKGYYYIVSTGGTFAGISFEVGDWIISNGSAWGKVDNTDAVSSVFGRTGNVTASNGDYNTSQVTENTNLYYTEARVNANANVAANTAARHNAVTLGTANGLSLNVQQLSLALASGSTTGALSSTDWTTFNNKENAITAGTTAQYFRGDKTFQTLNTGVVPESGNLYFTNARAIASVLTGYTSGAGTISAADTILSAIQKLNGNIGALVTGVSSVNGLTGAVTLTTTNIAEGTNLYYTEARVNANANVAANTAARHAAVTLGTANGLGLTGQQLSLGLASAGVTGALSGTDWSTFNSKQQALNGTGFVKISGTTISYDNSTYLTTAAAASTYLPLAGGTMTGNINWTANDVGLTWSRNTDGASIKFISVGDGTGESYLQIGTSDNGNEAIVFSQTSLIRVQIDTDGLLKNGSSQRYVFENGGTWGIAISGNAGTVTNGVVTTGSYSNPAWITALSWTKITDRPTTLAGYGITDAVPSSRTITINGTAQDLSANRTFNVGTVTSVAALTLGTSGTDLSSSVANGTTTPVITLNVPTASAANRGALSAADWTTFNNKQNALTNPVTGTGTTNYLPKFTGTSTIGNSQIFDNGTQVAVATNNASGYGTQRFLVLGNGAASQVTRFTDGANGDLVFDFPSQGVTRITSQFGTSGSLVFANGTGFNPRMTLDASGNLGLGVTPSAWSVYKAYQVGYGAIASYNDADTAIFSNAYFDGGTWRYIGSSYASQYRQLSSTHSWHTAPYGTAGNAISFTQAMTLGSNGGLSIGTPSAAPAQGLLVQGASNFNGNLTIFTAGYPYIDLGINSSNYWRIINDNPNDTFLIQKNASTILRIAGGGQATFSLGIEAKKALFGISGVATPSLIVNDNDQSNVRLRLQNSTSGNTWDLVGGLNAANNNDFSIYDVTNNVTALRIVPVSGAATFSSSVTANARSFIKGSAGYLFDVEEQGSNKARFQTYVVSNEVSLVAGYDTTAIPITFYTGNTERMRIFAGGNTHIGPTPGSDNGARLQVSGTATVSGSVGVNGVTSPAAELQVGKSSDVVIAMSNSSSVTSGARGSLSWYNSSVSTVALIRAAAVTDNVGTELQFHTRPAAGSLTQAMTLTSGGNLILTTGTVSDNGARLQVSADTQPNLRLHKTTGGGDGMIVMSTDFGGGNTYAINSYISGIANGGFEIKDITNNASRIVIWPSSGNVLIGTTSDNGARLQVSGGVHASSLTDGFINIGAAQINRTGGFVEMQFAGSSGVRFFGNTAYPITFASGTGAATFSSSVTATQFTAQSDSAYYRVRRGAGTDVGYITDSSTWGDSGTDFTIGASSANLRFYVNNNTIERMRITSGGNVLIGTTTPNGNTLRVGGNTWIDGNILMDNSISRYVGFGTGTENPYLLFAQNGSILFNVETNDTYTFRRGGSSLVTFTGSGIETLAGGLRTVAPTGTNNEFWRLGRALLATSADPEDRWIRVQLGTKIYDILAIDRGNA